ncbi:MAG: peptide deformylase [Omnitrophica bacterium RBG_13_46_9]|nr:MAG: peptide deformylase [Omnitrophica bacterium RBG_13_46_9]
MGSLHIRTYPDPLLRKKSRELLQVTDEEKELIGYMVETMYANRGVGLAAPQVGVAKRIIVVDAQTGLLKMINPRMVSAKGMSSLEEGCLSVPGRLVEVRRAEEISVSFMDMDNKESLKSFKGLTAKVIQHEIDHLDGKLILDYLPWYRRLLPKRGDVKCLQ